MKHLILQTPADRTLSAALVTELTTLTQAQSAESIQPHVWRLRNVAHADEIRQRTTALCEAQQADFAFVPAGQKLSDYKLVAMDMDSTLITIECIDEIADLVGLKKEVAAITEATMRGEIVDFKESLRRRVALLKGIEYSTLDKIYQDRLRLSLGAEAMLTGAKAAGLDTLLVSGGFTYFTDKLKQRLALDHTHANILGVRDGKLTGEVDGDIVDADGKKHYVEEICEYLDINPAQAIVLGDGANDLKMMSIAGISVAFRAKPVVREQTTYALNYAGLDGVLNWFE
ncbi:MAG: phosphoserine phosphatase SerB [Burkholderiaceae bacterium]|nr:MAG: phosphoserine phosphatase SerB [Burkholderiaceae bacterium]